MRAAATSPPDAKHLWEGTLPPLTAYATFLRWLPSEKVMGQRCSCDGCPLVAWLQLVYAGPLLVDEETIAFGTLDGQWQTCATPADYREFMFRIDYGGDTARTVTVREVRTVLKDLAAEGYSERIPYGDCDYDH